MIVRLKAILLGMIFSNVFYFNSMIVRLKVVQPVHLFDTALRFNSMIVRLKDLYVPGILIRDAEFQFYDSPIKRSRRCRQ